MKTYLSAYGVTATVFLAIDAVWLSTMTGAFYRPMLGSHLADQPRLVPAAFFYLLYIVGVVYFAVAPALQSEQWSTGLVNGALLGLIAYATYDLTNQATLREWPTALSVVDMAWGTFLTGMSATIGYVVTAWLTRN
ncbi:putative membrane protein [Microvirga flocculans]|uniref:Putative membrane protein n=1 Tax=Microvirga flocculans TaxID=217168 RepID=A0A7W6N8J0_9HYPH|nr:DUF2177 family protein [Microvirga flocculans]MBB4040485.1 putative membrane protein [Microvirga flocculans]